MAPAHPQPLRPIEGPSAFGGGGAVPEPLWLTSAQQYRLQYRTSVLGHLWAIFRPLTLFGILYFVFTQVLRFGAGIEEYALMVLLGIMMFQFFGDGPAPPSAPSSRTSRWCQDAFPEDRRSALGRVLDGDDGGDQPPGDARLRPRIRAGRAVDVAFGSGRVPGPGRPDDRRGATTLGTVRADQGRQPDLDGVFPGAVLREPDPVPAGAGPQSVPGDRRAEPARAHPHSGPDLGAATGCAVGRRDRGVASVLGSAAIGMASALRGCGYSCVKRPGSASCSDPRRNASRAPAAPPARTRTCSSSVGSRTRFATGSDVPDLAGPSGIRSSARTTRLSGRTSSRAFADRRSRSPRAPEGWPRRSRSGTRSRRRRRHPPRRS